MSCVKSFNIEYDETKHKFVLFFLTTDLNINVYTMYDVEPNKTVSYEIIYDMQTLANMGYSYNPSLKFS